MLASHQHNPADDDDRKNRFVHPDSSHPSSLRERAASQPPRSTAPSSSPSLPHTSTAYLSSVSPSLARPPASPWRFNSASHLNPSTQAMPIRSSSFSATAPSLQALSSLRESRGFPSTFEDDESEFNEGMSDQYTPVDDERFILPPQQQHRGRSFAADLTRSRSQSLATATTRPAPIGSPFSSSGLQGWLEGQPSSLSSHPLSIPTNGFPGGGGGPGARYGDIKPPGSSRYGSLGVQSHARSPLNHDLSSFPSSSFRRQPSTSSTSSSSTSYSPSAALQVPSAHNHNHGHHLSPGAGGFAGGSPHQVDISNMSPFMRDVGQILLDDGSAFREQLWSGMNPPRDENGGGGSGTTSRRHSVSVVQPRRGTIVGFNAPSSNTQHVNGGDFNDFAEDEFQGGGGGRVGGIFPGGGGGSFGRGGLLLTDEDLADNLNGLNLGGAGGEGTSSSSGHMGGQTSQPSSLPAYASRSPPSAGGLGSASYQALQLHIPGSIGRGGGGAGVIGTPSEGGTSPSLGEYLPHGHESSYLNHHQQQQQQHLQQQQQQQQQQGSGRGGVMPRYIPGMGIQMVPNDGPVSPTTYARLSSGGGRAGPNLAYHHQQQQQQQQQHVSQGSMFSQPLQRRPSSDFAQQQQQQQHAQGAGLGAQGVHDLGKGVPLHSVASCPLYIVEFKAGRTDLFYAMGMDGGVGDIRVGDLVIVEADRGKDLGKVINDTITIEDVEAYQRQMAMRFNSDAQSGMMSPTGNGGGPMSPGGMNGQGGMNGGGQGGMNGGGQGGMNGGGQGGMNGGGGQGAPKSLKEINPKQIYGKASGQDRTMMDQKMQDELKALQLCQQKVRQKKLPMEVVDAEYQWDRRKLTFYFVAEKRIDFRELVRELFRLYKTRIWMASLQGPSYEQ
ncbi:uncharacterized protein STEHIDRAFT_70518 [Stereum hirsutum FP-91666 SS1]|uniref:uncharacterized protein n=1 Tax=Stereum hirsutum (strain FP-91666) TaxID=721885 RepID=UPI000440EC71|nr:uncharacterized protein STEHIDRAFT_70518 [Stereum hirsutum FP-91666 SS1]EIM92052.1 hypothetical protein STEHIDRAFT_70518 [Stereum hirsutum FP-91666 SS1]